MPLFQCAQKDKTCEGEEDDFGRRFSSLALDAWTGFPAQEAAAGLCSRRLALHNLQNAHPFAEVWKMGGGGGVEGGGDVRSSAIYGRGGLKSPQTQLVGWLFGRVCVVNNNRI